MILNNTHLRELFDEAHISDDRVLLTPETIYTYKSPRIDAEGSHYSRTSEVEAWDGEWTLSSGSYLVNFDVDLTGIDVDVNGVLYPSRDATLVGAYPVARACYPNDTLDTTLRVEKSVAITTDAILGELVLTMSGVNNE